MISEMEQMLNMKAPKGLSDLKDAPVRFKWVIGKENMPEVVDRMLKPIKTGV